MREILPEVFHWTARHPKIGIPVSSYWLRSEGVLLDPMIPQEGLERFVPPPTDILLTNRHHYRESGKFVERFGCRVWCVEQGLHEFRSGEPVQGFRFGARLVGGIEAFEIDVLCPDETAFVVPRAGGIVAVADGVIREDDGPLTFVPDAYMGENPRQVKRGLRAAYLRLVESREFSHLLLAHGQPWIGGAHEALRAFAASGS